MIQYQLCKSKSKKSSVYDTWKKPRLNVINQNKSESIIIKELPKVSFIFWGKVSLSFQEPLNHLCVTSNYK